MTESSLRHMCTLSQTYRASGRSSRVTPNAFVRIIAHISSTRVRWSRESIRADPRLPLDSLIAGGVGTSGAAEDSLAEDGLMFNVSRRGLVMGRRIGYYPSGLASVDPLCGLAGLLASLST